MTNADPPHRSGGTASGLSRFIQPLSMAHRRFASRRRTIVDDVVQGSIIGGLVLGFITFKIVSHTYVTNINGWITMYGCGKPGISIFLRGACASSFPGPINVAQEAMYWLTNKDGAGQRLTGAHNYILRFSPGGLPPNHAFWSLTMGDARNRFVANPISRFSVSDRSGLIADADGSVNIYIQHAAPAGHESNWLPAPAGNFLLWLRVYLPAKTILDGQYKVPPVVKTP